MPFDFGVGSQRFPDRAVYRLFGWTPLYRVADLQCICHAELLALPKIMRRL